MGPLGFFLITGVLFSIALYAAGYYVWSVPEQEASDRLGSRLRELRAHMRSHSQKAPELLRREHRGQFAFLGDLVTWVGVLRRLQTIIEQANLKYRAADVFGLSVALAVSCFLLTTLFGMMFFLRILFSVLLGFAPVMYILSVRSRRMKKFEEQLPDAIDLFTRTMRAGHNIHSGLETIATETSDPVKMEFKKLMEELALGSQVEPALHGLGKRVPLLDLKFFITALILQRQTGANMVAVLENLSTLVRERLNMAAKMKAHTAQQRFSAGLLCCLPLVVGIGFWILKPDYVRLLWTDPVGIKFFTYAICSEIVGILVIRKLANIKYEEDDTMALVTNLLLFLFTGGTLCLLVWTSFELFRAQEDPLSDRLEGLQSQAMVVAARATRRKKSAQGLDRFLYLIALVPGGEDWMNGTEKLLAQAGIRRKSALALYCIFVLLFVFALCAGIVYLQRDNPNGASSLLGGLVAAFLLGFILPKQILYRLVKSYRAKLQEALPDTVDLLGIVLGTGLGLDQAMMRVSEEMQYIYPELANEFATVVMQVRAGQERGKSFNQFVRRTGIEDIKSLAAMIIQSEKFGTSLAQALKVYADALRTRRRLRAEAAVGKAGIKMLFPIVVFILPVLFVITLVPGMLSVLKDLKLLGGGR